MAQGVIPQSIQKKIMRLTDQEVQANALVNATLRTIGNSPHGDNAHAMRQELAFTQNTLSTRQTRHRFIAALNANIREYLAGLPADVEVSESKAVKLKLHEGEDHRDAVDRIRGEIAALNAEKAKIDRAETTKDERKATIKGWVERQRARGKPFMRWKDGQTIVTFDTNIEDAYSPTRDVPAMLAWLNPKMLEARLIEEIDAQPEGFTMSREDKAARLKEIARETLSLSRIEEAHIVAAEERDQVISRRVEAAPRAVLGLVVRGLWKSKAA